MMHSFANSSLKQQVQPIRCSGSWVRHHAERLDASLTCCNENHLAPLHLIDDASAQPPQSVTQPEVQTLQHWQSLATRQETFIGYPVMGKQGGQAQVCLGYQESGSQEAAQLQQYLVSLRMPV